MKLHLPKGLRAALIAAFGIIGFTLPQTQAWDGGPEDDVGGMGHVYYLNNGKEGVSLTDTSRNNLVITPNASNVTGEISSITTKDGASVRFTGSNGWHNDWQFSSLLVDMLQAGEDGQGTVSVSTEQKNATRPASDTTVSILAVSGTVGSVENYGVLTLGTDGGSISASGTFNNHDGATLTINGSYVFDISDTTKYILRSEGSVEWSDSANSQGFKKTSSSTYYAIKGATEGDGIGEITSSSGTAITLESPGNYYFEGGTASDFDYTKFYVKADTATLEHTGEGQIIVEKEGATLTVRNATFRDTSGSKNLNIVVEDGGVLEVTHSGGSGYVTGDININGGGTFHVAGQHDAFGWGATTTKRITLQGTDDSHVATLVLQQTTGNSVTMNAALSLMGNASITGAKGFNTHDGSFYAEGLNNTIESFQIRHAATFEVNEGGELTVGTMTKGQDGNKTLTKTGMGTMTFTTKAQAEALVINEGAIVIAGSEENSFNAITIGADGTLKLTGSASLTMSGNLTSAGDIIKDGDGTLVFSGTQNVLGRTIAANSGYLTLSGSYEIGDIASEGETSYAGGQHTGNGYATATGTVTVYTGDATVDDTQAVFTYHRSEVAVEGGVYTLPGTQDNTTYYINAGTDSYTWIDTNKIGELTGGIVVKEGATLQADKAMSMAEVAASSRGTVQIDEGIVVSSDGGSQHVALTGKGTYALQGGVQTLGSVDASGFDGWVRLTGGMTNINLDGNLQGKNVELSGVSGYFKNVDADSQAVFNGNLRLTDVDAGTPAITITDGFSRDRAYLVFSGAVSGDGTWELNCGATQHYVFSGDISDWDGTFHVTRSGPNNGGTSINFKDAANTVNATIAREGGTLRLFADTDVTFNKAVTGISSLTVADAKTATIATNEDSSIIGGISGTGTLVKGGTGTLTVSGAPYTGTDTAPIPATAKINVTAGTLKATTAGTLGSGAITVANGATLEMTIGNVLGATQAVSNSGNVIIHNTLTAGTINGGVLTLAGDFPVDGGGLEDVDGATTGNGFSQGGVMHVYTPATAELTGGVKVMKGDTDYTSQMDANGDITMSGADWTTYQLNVENEDQPTIKQIIDYASSKGSALASIVVNGGGLSLVDDTTTFKTSMLSGSELASLDLTLVDEAVLTMDADLAGNLSLGGLTGDASATIVLEKDVAAQKSLWLYNMEGGGISTLTIKGAHTITTPLLGSMFGKFVLQEGAKLAVAETGFGMTAGDSIEIQDAAELDLGKVSIKSVDGTKAATMMNESDEDAYDIGSTRYSLTDACVTISYSDAAHNFGHELKGTSSLVNAGTSSVNDINALNTTYDELHAQNGDIYLSGRTSGVTVRNLTVGEGHGVYMNGSDETITVNGTATFGDEAKVSSALTMAGGTTLNADGPVALDTHALSLEKDINIGDKLWSTLNALAPEATTNIFTGVSALTLGGEAYSTEVDLNDIFNHSSLQAHKYTLSFEGGNVIVTKNKDNDRYWKGGSGSWNTTATNLWTDEETGGSDVPFVSGYNAHFTSASGGVITLGENITATNVYVSGANYGFKNDGHTLTVTNLFEVNGSYQATLAFGLSGENLKLTVKNGGSLVLNDTSSVKAVEIGEGELECNSGSLTVTGSLVNNGMLGAETLILSQGTAQGGNVDVGSLNLADNKAYTFGNLNAGTVNGSNASVTIDDSGALNAATAATLKSLTTGDSAHLSGNITVAGATNIGGGTTMTGNLTTGTLTGYPLSVSNGHLTIASGSLAPVQFTGTSSVTTNGTITLDGALGNNGDLTLKGTYDASNLGASKSDSKYVEGGSTDNGFEQARLTLTIVEGGNTIAGEATIRFRDKTLTEKVDANGKVTFGGDIDYTKYYVNSGTENASKALDNPNQRLGTFELKTGTKLLADRDFDISKVNAAGAATLEIASGHQVTSSGAAKSLTLTGSGTYALASGVSTLGVTLDNTWAGTVSFTEAQLTSLVGAWKSSSTVSLTGITGSLGSNLIEGKVVLNKGTDGWGFGQTETAGTQYTNLENTLTGDGNLGVKSGSVDSTFNLNGNIDGWTGNFIVATDADTDLNLGGSGPKTVHGTVGGSNLAVNVNADTTFEGALNVAEINVNDSKTATLKADSTADRVDTSNGSLKVNNGKTLTVTGFTGPEGLKLGAGASIVLQGTAYMGGEDYGYVGGTVANSEGTDQDVTIHNSKITVTDTTLRVNGGSGFTVDNKLVNATLAVENGLPSTVTLNNVQDSLEVAGNLEIGPGGLLKVAQNNGTAKQTLNISGGTTLTLANDTTLDADLTLNRGATLKLDYNMGTPVATTLNGGGLTLYKGLTLSGDLYETLKGLSTEGASVTLFSNVDTIVFDGATSPTVDASAYFTNLMDLEGDYTFNYDEGLLSIVFSEATSRQLVWDGTETEHRWVAYEPEAIDPEVKDWYQPSTETETHFAQGDIATFGADADVKVVNLSAGETTAKRVTIKDAADYEFVADAAGSKLSANRFEVKEGATLNKSGTGTLILEVGENVTVDTAGFFVDEGELVIGTAEMPGTLALDNGVMEVAEDATLRVAKIQDSEGSLIAVCGTLNVASGSLHAIHTIEGSTLVISNVNGVSAGTLTIDSDTTLRTLENHGTLDVGTHSLTLTEAAVQGGNVTAGSLHLGEFGSTFGDVTTDTVHFAYGMLDVVDPNVAVDTIVSNAGAIITLDLTDSLTDSGCLSPMHRQDMPTTYTLIHAEDGLGTTSFTLGETLGLLVQNGLIHEGEGLTMTEKDVKITVGGQSLIWYTDKDVTEWGYQVVSGDALTAGGNTLNGVEHVVVDASRRIDVTGAGSAPGLRVRNITGLDGRTITFTGTEDDTVNLITSEETSSNVNVAAENITLKVGLDELDEMDPVDYKDLRVGDVNLTSATLDVHDHEGLDDSFTVNSLNGDSASLLKGTLIVEGQGGTYNGGYEGATVILHKDADQALAAGRGLTVMGLGLARITYSGTETHMGGIEGIGLRVMLNDVETDNSHRTLTLDNEYSYIVDGALGVGLSAIESGLTLDSEAAPDLLRAEHLDMSGSTLYIYQPASDGDTLTMDVNDGGYKRGLLLANLGADDTTANAVQLIGDLYNKYYQNARLQNGRVLVDRRTDYFSSITEPTSENGRAGAGMLDDALLYNNPQATQAGGDLAVVMTALEKGGYTHDRADKVMAAMSGASQAAMGAAWNRDVDRQLRAIRNRTTQMGLAECTHHEGLPYFNAWINAEGDYTKLSGDGTLAGYKLSSWGGTVGVDVDCTARFTVGAAVTAMSGDFTAESADQAEGDLDRLYVSVFGRYTRRAWTHTLVATFGMADTKLKRTVNYGYGSYNTESSSDGKAFGVMYEVGYVTALNEDASTCLQPVLNLSYRHSSLGGSTEQSASDAALRLGDVDANVFTAAIGARLQSAVGTSVYNRSSIFEGRVMLKFDAGDRDTTAGNGFIGMPGSRSTKSTEAGMFGVEVGAGLTIPLSENAGALFFDVTGDFRAKDTEFNGTVGYRYNF